MAGSVRVNTVLDDSILERIDAYRRRHPDMPQRATALRLLAVIGLDVVEAKEQKSRGSSEQCQEATH